MLAVASEASYQNPWTELDRMVWLYNLSTIQAEIIGCEACWLTSLAYLVSSRLLRGLISKRKNKKTKVDGPSETTPELDLWHLQVHLHVHHTHTCTHTHEHTCMCIRIHTDTHSHTPHQRLRINIYNKISIGYLIFFQRNGRGKMNECHKIVVLN